MGEVIKLEDKQKLDTVSVWELMGNKFYVPDYQRGYRWTDVEVIKLLDDLTEYKDNYKDDDSFYCMQPLVVYYNKNESAWEVIDGQQRLTTLFLLLNYDSDILRKIKKNNSQIFKLTYQSRPDSEIFLSPEFADKDNNIHKFIDLLINRENIEEEISINQFPYQTKNVDYFHICNSLLTISNFFKSNNIDSEYFLDKILNIKNKDKEPIVNFIWYDVTKEIEENKIESEEIFSRLNVGKISLTNAELIKALFLNRVDKELDNISDEKIRAQISEQLKIKISTDWDLIEHSLLDSDFWSFIYGEDDSKYDTRIEFLFDLIQHKSILHKDEEYFTFDKYAGEFKLFKSENINDDNSVSQKWKQLTDQFYLYKNWYENKDLYHLIGFLRYKKIDITKITEIQNISDTNSDFVWKLRRWCVYLALLNEIEINDFNIENYFKNSNSKTEKEFKNFVLERLKSFDYMETYDQIKDTLLLFNILTSLDCEKESVRFSFNDFYNEGWDIEHVRSQTDKGLSGSDRVDWILTNLGYFSGVSFPFEKRLNKVQKEENISLMIKRIKNELNELQNQQIISPNTEYPKGIDASEIVNGLLNLLKDKKEKTPLEHSKTYLQIRNGIIHEDNSTLKNKNGIHNLVLLDLGTNRSYKNAFFPVKRKWINEREKNGVYILPCTKNVFSKNYSSKLFDLMNWNDSDAKNYFEEIYLCLTKTSNI